MTPSIPNTAYLWPSHSLSFGEARREYASGEHAVSAAPTQKHMKRTAAALLEGHGRLYKEVRGTVSLTRADLCWPANQGVGCPSVRSLGVRSSSCRRLHSCGRRLSLVTRRAWQSRPWCRCLSVSRARAHKHFTELTIGLCAEPNRRKLQKFNCTE